MIDFLAGMMYNINGILHTIRLVQKNRIITDLSFLANLYWNRIIFEPE